MAQTPLVGSSRPVAANKIIEWQREMIKRELDFIAPDIVLFLSGSMGGSPAIRLPAIPKRRLR